MPKGDKRKLEPAATGFTPPQKQTDEKQTPAFKLNPSKLTPPTKPTDEAPGAPGKDQPQAGGSKQGQRPPLPLPRTAKQASRVLQRILEQEAEVDNDNDGNAGRDAEAVQGAAGTAEIAGAAGEAA